MIVPTRRFVVFGVAGTVLALLPILVVPHAWVVWAAYVAVLAVLALGDLALTPSRGLVELNVVTPDLIYIGADAVLSVEIGVPRWRRAARFHGLVEVDPDLVEPELFEIDVPAQGRGVVSLTLSAHRRGRPMVRLVWLRWQGPSGLLERRLRQPLDTVVRVAPNVRAVQTAALRMFSNREFLTGLKVERHLGEGSEFDALRDYVQGMDPRAIDWKASARHTKLICRQFRAERNHQIVLAFDTGHLMSEPLNGVPKLDHAINAALLLGYVSLRTGDRVGMLSFDAEVRSVLAPQSGVSALRRLQEHAADIDYTATETNFTLGLTTLLGHLNRRSLVVLFTDFVDSVTAELLVENARRLSRRHVLLFVALRDAGLDAMEHALPQSIDDVNRSVVAGDLVRERDVVLSRLRRMGVLVLDAPPERLSANLINRYLDVKRRELVG